MYTLLLRDTTRREWWSDGLGRRGCGRTYKGGLVES